MDTRTNKWNFPNQEHSRLTTGVLKNGEKLTFKYIDQQKRKITKMVKNSNKREDIHEKVTDEGEDIHEKVSDEAQDISEKDSDEGEDILEKGSEEGEDTS